MLDMIFLDEKGTVSRSFFAEKQNFLFARLLLKLIRKKATF